VEQLEGRAPEETEIEIPETEVVSDNHSIATNA